MRPGHFLSGTLALALCACAVGPDFHHPKITTPAAFSGLGATGSPPPDDASVLAHWWTDFGDDKLNQLVEEALQGNLDIQSASARIAQARAQVDSARAGLFPQFSASGSDMRYRIPDSIRDIPQAAASQVPVVGGAASAAAGSFQLPGYLSVYRAGFDASWELDLWGGTRRQIESARASEAAAVFARRGAVVSALAELGNDYASLRITQARIDLAARTEAGDGRLLALTENRKKNGLASDLDVAQARSTLADTRATLPPLKAQAMQLIHAIAILLGRTPESMESELGTTAPPLKVPMAIPVGLPATVLLNRPDIERADRQLASANAQVGAALAQRLPSLALTGSTGYASDALTDLLKHSSWTWSLGGTLTAPIFDFGRLEANQRAAAAAANEQMLAYRKTVLQALQDVEDSLQQCAASEARREALQVASEAARLSLQRATEQYRSGLASYINVLQSDHNYAMTLDELEQADQARAQSMVGLYKALGGGWQAGESQLLPQLRLDDAWHGPKDDSGESARVVSGSS